MNHTFRVLVTIVCVLATIVFISSIFIKFYYPEEASLINSIRSIFAILILGAGIAIAKRIWSEKDMHLLAKIIWSFLLILFFPNFTIPIYIWLVEPKLKLKAEKSTTVQ